MEVVIARNMMMTQGQAKRLGQLVASARARKGISTRALAAEIGVANGWINGIEAGRFLETSADRLARLAETLDIEPARIDRLTKRTVGDGLPGMKTYFRAKYDLTPEEIAKVERYVERFRREP
jgi:transcriptional regulator with XRE-family HTH domain